MDKKRIAEVTKALMEINETISKLDSSIRQPAFDLLAPLYFDTKLPQEKYDIRDRQHAPSPTDAGKFYAAHPHSKLSDNVLLIAAWLYSQHGNVTITADVIKNEAKEASLIVPARPDMTMQKAQAKNKPLFRKSRKGYQLTPHGELFIKDEFHVTKGNKPLPEEPTE